MDQLLALRVFVRIADAGSFATAADSLNLPRSSVSKLLQDLGTKLVERSTRALTITPEGEAYRDQALDLLANLDEMDLAARDARVKPRGRLRVESARHWQTRSSFRHCPISVAAIRIWNCCSGSTTARSI